MSVKPESESNAPGRLESYFQGHEASVHGNRWQALWEEAYTPWDRGQPSPALIELLEDKSELVGGCWTKDPASGLRRKRALVPGCGRGYDVLILSAFGYDAYGLDVSEAAMNAAREHEKLKSGDDVYEARDPQGKGNVHWITADFFKDDFLKDVGGNGTFDLLFDYTFLSALPISLRPAWSARLAQLLSPTGALICVEWPSTKDPKAGGPPWPLPPSVYTAHLPRPGQKLEYSKNHVLLEENLGPEAKDSLQRVAHFHPTKTHNAGITNGSVTDYVGVWKHKSVARDSMQT